MEPISQWMPILLPSVLFLMMLALGLSLNLADFQKTLAAPRLLLIGLACQLLLLPILGVLLIVLFGLSDEMAVALLIVCLAPGGATSNMLSHLSGGDTSLSVLLTAISSLITPFTLPLLAWLAADYWLEAQAHIDFPLLRAVLQLLLISMLPIALGMLAHQLYPTLAANGYRWLRKFSIAGLFFLVVVMVAAQWQQVGSTLQQLWLVCILLFFGAYVLGFFSARMMRGGRSAEISLGFETGIQNAGTAIFVTGVLLGSPVMASVALLYGVLMQMPALAVLCYWMYRAQQNYLSYSSSPQ